VGLSSSDAVGRFCGGTYDNHFLMVCQKPGVVCGAPPFPKPLRLQGACQQNQNSAFSRSGQRPSALDLIAGPFRGQFLCSCFLSSSAKMIVASFASSFSVAQTRWIRTTDLLVRNSGRSPCGLPKLCRTEQTVRTSVRTFVESYAKCRVVVRR
jgi:hypothetical protein